MRLNGLMCLGPSRVVAFRRNRNPLAALQAMCHSGQRTLAIKTINDLRPVRVSYSQRPTLQPANSARGERARCTFERAHAMPQAAQMLESQSAGWAISAAARGSLRTHPTIILTRPNHALHARPDPDHCLAAGAGLLIHDGRFHSHSACRRHHRHPGAGHSRQESWLSEPLLTARPGCREKWWTALFTRAEYELGGQRKRPTSNGPELPGSHGWTIFEGARCSRNHSAAR